MDGQRFEVDNNVWVVGDDQECVTGRSFSDVDLIMASITERLLGLPGDTVVKTGHGDDTTIDAERGNVS